MCSTGEISDGKAVKEDGRVKRDPEGRWLARTHVTGFLADTVSPFPPSLSLVLFPAYFAASNPPLFFILRLSRSRLRRGFW